MSLPATPKWEGIADEWTHRNMGAIQRAGGGGEGDDMGAEKRCLTVFKLAEERTREKLRQFM